MERESIRNLVLIYSAAWLRSFGIGFFGVVLDLSATRYRAA
jgi:hypothetical protein